MEPKAEGLPLQICAHAKAAAGKQCRVRAWKAGVLELEASAIHPGSTRHWLH